MAFRSTAIRTRSVLSRSVLTGVLMLASFAVCVVTGGIVSAQIPRFDVASVRLVRPGAHPAPNFVGGVQGGTVRIAAMTAGDLLRLAYPEFRERGRIAEEPPWARTELFEVIATFDPRILKQSLPVDMVERDPTVPPAVSLMMRSLLQERFGLETHVEARDVNVLDLVIAGSGGNLGPALRPAIKECGATSGSPCGVGILKEGVPRIMGGTGVPFSRFVAFLQTTGEIDRPIRDLTGLKGFYDFEYPVYPRAERNDSRSVFAILQEQHGLKLEQRRGQLSFLVIDRFARPTAN
jgi:uncharacterized protein (TIGR03435 family)